MEISAKGVGHSTPISELPVAHIDHEAIRLCIIIMELIQNSDTGVGRASRLFAHSSVANRDVEHPILIRIEQGNPKTSLRDARNTKTGLDCRIGQYAVTCTEVQRIGLFIQVG